MGFESVAWNIASSSSNFYELDTAEFYSFKLQAYKATYSTFLFDIFSHKKLYFLSMTIETFFS